MKKKLEVNSPEFRDLVGKLTTTRLTLPNLVTLPPLPKIPMSPTPLSTTAKSPTKFPPLVVKKTEKDVTFTGVKDVDMLILMQLDDKSLFRTCKVNKYVNDLCKSENFWRNRLQNRFDVITKPEDKTWKNYYVELAEEEKGLNLYWSGRSRYNRRDEGGFRLDKKLYKEKDDVLIVANVYKNLKNTRDPVLGIYEVKTKKLVSPLFNSPSSLKYFRSQQPDEFRQRIDLATFKIHRPLYTEELVYVDGRTGKQGNFNLPSAE